LVGVIEFGTNGLDQAYVLYLFSSARYRPAMPDGENLALADPKDIADTAAFAVLFSGRKRVHDSDRSIGRDSD